MNARTRGIVDMSTAMIIAGTVGWFVLETRMPAVSVVFWRCAFGALAMLIACGCLGLLRRGVIDARQAALAVLGGVALVANWVLLFAAYGHASIAVATVTYHTQPFLLVALGALLFGERPTANKLAWLGVAFGGILLIVAGGHQPATPSGDYLAGVGLALAAAFFYALAAAVTKRLDGVSPYLIVTIQMVVGSVLLAPFATLPDDVSSPRTWGLLLAIGFIHTGLMSTLLYGAIQKISTSLVGVLSFLYPIVAIVVDALAFGHLLGALQIGGAVAILVAVAGMNFGWRIFRAHRAQT
ncbi:DMT family transporter [Massilia sp. CFBP9012]|uniref:DMT family transporter n=1 Tax=Massilia sp. CFBP9012 TaxID=3096531 RepID=UPI002A6B7E4D|nr:DMT family transporter [Massilia sp. CFBP9012]MDY0975720.1 DMT family transporter [Massilia sp. CFBP9012]